MANKVKAKDFVEQVELLEEVVIALWSAQDEEVESYDYARKAAGTMTIAEWIDGRVKPKVGDIKVRIIDGKHGAPHRGQRMDTLRNSYKETE